MALPNVFTNVGSPIIDATQVNANFTYLDTGKGRNVKVVGIAADGSAAATAVSLSPVFPTAITYFEGITFVNYSASDVPVLAYKITNITASGFDIQVGGGDAGSTVDVHLKVIGD